MSASLAAIRVSEHELALPRERERMFETLIANLPGLAYRAACDAHWTLEYASDGCLELTGYPPSTFLGQSGFAYLNIINRDDRARVNAEIDDAIARGDPWTTTYRIMTASREERWVWERGRVVVDGTGIAHYEGFATDVTERVLAESAMHESDLRFRALFERSSLGVGVVEDRTNRFLQVNDRYCEITGFTREEMLGLTAADITHPADIESDARQTKQFLAGSGVAAGYHSEKRYVRPDGRVVWAALTIVPLPQNGSANSARHLTLVEDVTEKRAARVALQRSEAHARAVVENAPVVLWALDKEGTFTLSVGKALAAIGLHPDEVLGRSVFDVYRDFPAVIEGVRGSLAGETRAWEVDLGGVLFESLSEPMIDENGEVVGVIGVAVDVTARRCVESDRLQNAEALRRTLVSAVAALGSTISTRDPYTAGHQERVTALALAIAKRLGLGDESREALRFAGELHDIGKISVPTEILNKPGRLSEAEFALIKCHATSGYEIVRQIEFAQPIAEIVHQHHERVDGSGYPRGLTGDETLLEAKVLAVADVVEAMASHRPYRPALGIDAALAEIVARRGVLYDPAVVDACREVFRTDGFTLE